MGESEAKKLWRRLGKRREAEEEEEERVCREADEDGVREARRGEAGLYDETSGSDEETAAP